jgi:hypothetical protein
MKLSSTGKNPCGPLAGIRDRDRRPCEGFSQASATQPVVSARAASQSQPNWSWGADVRLESRRYLPDTFCATIESRSAIVPDGCAMISRSVGQRVGSSFLQRVAKRGTPMMGIDRSNLSYRTFLILFVLLGSPMAARSGTLEDFARELARKIEPILPERVGGSCEVRNSSTLRPEEVARVEQALMVELQNRGTCTSVNGGASAGVVVTLSENVKEFVWIAELHQGDESRVVLLAVLRSALSPKSAEPPPATLRSERFWEGPERILDAATMVTPDGDQVLALLFPDRLIVRSATKKTENKIEIPLLTTKAKLRETPGIMTQSADRLVHIEHERRGCTVSLETNSLIECQDYQGGDAASIGPAFKGGLAVPVLTKCTQGPGWFVTGTGDDTQPDSVQIMESRTPDPIVVSNQLDFPGPIVDLHYDSNDPSARAIVRNLHTGNYEAYHLSISCGQ